jgi:hypothetical protein
MDDHREDMRQGMPGWIIAAMLILAIVAVGGVGFGWYNYNGMINTQQSTAAQLKTAQQDTAQQISALDERLTDADASNATLQSDLSAVTKRLRVTATQTDLKKTREETAEETTQIRTDSEQKITDLDTNVKTQLATKASNDDVSAVNSSVTVVKTDLEGTKNDLKMARSELGTLIARNHEEIDVLRRMGERDYVEFTIIGRNKPQKVGAFTVELRSVDAKKNKFTVALVVNDLRTEKKDRTVNEPIVFYPDGSTHQANEFVVNSVAKDKITGYISMPKNPGLTSTVASGN